MTRAPKPNAFTIPSRTFAIELSRAKRSAHEPTRAQQYFHISKPGDALKTARIKKANI